MLRRRIAALAQFALHIEHVDPFAVFATDVFKRAAGPEARAGMEHDRTRLGPGDHCKSLPETARLTLGNQCIDQGRSHTSPLETVTHINADLARIAIAGERMERGCIGIADHRSIAAARDKAGEAAIQRLADPFGDFRSGGRIGFECRGALLYIVGINLRDGRRIDQSGRIDGNRITHHRRMPETARQAKLRFVGQLPTAQVMHRRDIDIAILGGGLAGGLIALTLANTRPDLSLLVVEAGETLGGNHVWSFFASDVAMDDAWLLEPLIAARWDSYDVHFPAHSRTLATPYRSITSERLDAALREVLPAGSLLTGAAVASATPKSFELADGQTISAGGVIDARGASALPHMAGGWQKFAGQMLRLEQPHGLERPVVMDARVEQIDGYRFVYCLPFSASEVFIEDTYYADTAELDVPTLRRRIAAYANAQSWKIAEISREETGVLPVIAAGNFDAFWQAQGRDTALAGTRAALVHPLTSYSLPDAARYARHIGQLTDLGGAALCKASYDWASRHWRQGKFYRMLTTMLFSAAAPQDRFRILERFYRLPAGLVERFYSGRSTPGDKLRILAGKPPVPITAALASLFGQGRPLSSLDHQPPEDQQR